MLIFWKVTCWYKYIERYKRTPNNKEKGSKIKETPSHKPASNSFLNVCVVVLEVLCKRFFKRGFFKCASND